jgi:hypothetical protein
MTGRPSRLRTALPLAVVAAIGLLALVIVTDPRCMWIASRYPHALDA